MLAICDDTLINESPILFLTSPNYTLEEKFAIVEKYIYGLHLPLVQNYYCNHDIKIKNNTINYFERGKHAQDCHDKFSNPLYVPKFSKLHFSSDYIVKFACSACNYYERRGDKRLLYIPINFKMQ